MVGLQPLGAAQDCENVLPAGLSPARWPCPMHQSKTVFILGRSRVAVSVLDVHIGSRTPNASDVVILSPVVSPSTGMA